LTEILSTNKVLRDRKKTTKERLEAMYPRVQEALDSGDPQRVIDALSPKQRLFVEEYIKDFNAAAACIRAGYDTPRENANRMGYQLLQHPGIRYAIDALLAERSKEIHIDPNFVLKKIIRSLERSEEKGNETAVLRAAELLAKHLGMFVERTEISGPDGEAIKMEKIQQDVDEVTRTIAQLAQRGRAQEDSGGDGSGDSSES
jgi:phage terminase small subunit